MSTIEQDDNHSDSISILPAELLNPVRRKPGRPKGSVTTEDKPKKPRKPRKKETKPRNLKRPRNPKPKVKSPGKRGRKRRCLSYDEAVAIVRRENLSSAGMYQKWWNINRPAKLPKNPDRAYKKEWNGWGEFLDFYNEFPCNRIDFVTYEEAKRYAMRFGLKDKEAWLRHYRSGSVPKYIPNRPDVVYNIRGSWISWNDFLGVKIEDRIESARNKTIYAYIMKFRETPSNIFCIRISSELKAGIDLFCKKHNAKLGAIYLIEDASMDKNYNKIIENNCIPQFHRFGDDQYLVNNIHSLLSDFSLEYQRLAVND